MRKICTPVFNFAELSESAKEEARSWYRSVSMDDQWYESVYEDAANIADILGIDIRNRKLTFHDGSTRYDGINIGFRGFCCQGDGAHFEGSYRYAKGAAKAIREYAPLDVKLHRIADDLQAIQRKYFYGITAEVKHSGHYQHENCTDIDVMLSNENIDDYPSINVQDEVSEILRDFMRWIYCALEKEYELLQSDEVVDENIAISGHEFTEDGKRSISIH